MKKFLTLFSLFALGIIAKSELLPTSIIDRHPEKTGYTVYLTLVFNDTDFELAEPSKVCTITSADGQFHYDKCGVNFRKENNQYTVTFGTTSNGTVQTPFNAPYPQGHKIVITIPAHAFRDKATGGFWPGSPQSYSVYAQDNSAPTAVISAPATYYNLGGRSFHEVKEDLNNFYLVHFDEQVEKGSGTITFKNLENPSRTRVLDVNDPRVQLIHDTIQHSDLLRSHVLLRPDFLVSDGDILGTTNGNYSDEYQIIMEPTCFKEISGYKRQLADTVKSGVFEVRGNTPLDFSLNSYKLIENRPITTVVGTFSTVGSQDNHEYELVDSENYPDNNLFYITGYKQLRANFIADYETKNSYHLRVKLKTFAEDIYKDITVIIENDTYETKIVTSYNPINSPILPTRPGKVVKSIRLKFQQPISFSPLSLGDFLGTFSLVETSSSKVIETLKPGSPNLLIFQDSTLVINLTANLKTATQYHVLITEKFLNSFRGFLDSDDYTFVTPNVIASPFNSPTDIQLSSNAIDEEAGIFTTPYVGKLTATDADLQETFTYYFTESGLTTSYDQKFKIEYVPFPVNDKGFFLKANTTLDYEDQNLYNYEITVEDSDGNTYSEFFTINVIDSENEAPSDILFEGNFVQEDAPVGSEMGTLSTIDDAFNTHTYSLVTGEGADDNDKFSISGNLVKSKSLFDLSTQDLFSIRVRTRDQSNQIFEKVLSILVRESWEGSDNGNLTLTKYTQNLTLKTPSDQVFQEGMTFIIKATSDAGFPVGKQVLDGNAYFVGDTLHVLSPGFIKIRAEQPGNISVMSALIEKSFTISKIPQVLSAPVTKDKNVSDGDFEINVKTNGVLPVYVKSVSGPVTYDSQSKKFTPSGQEGLVEVTYAQEGNQYYEKAQDVTVSFNMILITALNDVNETSFGIYPNPASDVLNIVNATSWEIFSAQGVSILGGTENQINVASLASGIYIIKSGISTLKFEVK